MRVKDCMKRNVRSINASATVAEAAQVFVRHPIGVLPAAVFFAIVITGAEAMSRVTGVPVFLADVIQGAALVTMLAALMLTQYRIRWDRPAHE